MKKYLMNTMAAMAVGLFAVSCSNNDVFDASADQTVAKYEAAFKAHFGNPAPDQDWGFSISRGNLTRSATINGDVYDMFTFPTSNELLAVYPTTIPGDADEIKDLSGDLFWVYCNNGTHNYKVTNTGEVEIGGSWDCKQNWDTPQCISVYVKVNGNVTLKRRGPEYMNIYILQGNVTLDSNFGEFSGTISVAEGATLNDGRDHLAHNDGVHLYNRGTLNTGAYKIGNHAYVYNEGNFYVDGILNYNAGAGNPPCFYNVGDDVELTADEFILDSNGGFVSDGTVVISGSTKVTQAGIVWVNNGHYTTGSLNFSAGNATFYNYCQLNVTGNCKFLDGEFNMMANSYAEMGTGLFNNFIVNMHNNSGINIKNGSKWGRQQQGTFQGFKAVNDNAVVYVRLGDQTYVPAHKGGAFHVQGAKLTLAYNNIKFFNNYNEIGQYSEYSGISFWEETSAEALEAVQSENITWDLHNVTNIVTGSDFAATSFTTTTGSCSATWNGPKPPVEDFIPDIRVMAEDLSAEEAGDFDFNDVVFDVMWTATGAKIRLVAAGGTLPLTVGGEEVHGQFNVGTSVMVNTIDGKKTEYPMPIFNITGNFEDADGNNDANLIPVLVFKNNEWKTLTAVKGRVPSKIGVDPNTDWCDERQDIDEKWDGQFSEWVQGHRATFY